MKSPLWILNSTLALLCIITLLFILFSPKKLPPKRTLRPQRIPHITPKEASKINLARIYESDLFGTQSMPIEPEKPAYQKPQIPQPPSPKRPVDTQSQIPEFLPPLAVSLKGIIFVNDDSENRAIIQLNKTKKEKLYKIGDIVEDAELIKITRSKIILIRPNGQQETIFLTEKLAQEEQIYLRNTSWEPAVRQLDNNHYALSLPLIQERITNIAQLIDTLDITTAFDQGRSIGCRIGRIAPQSFGQALGFMFGDIITSINGTPTTTTSDRVTIYQNIRNMSDDCTILVKFLRENKEKEHIYLLSKQEPVKKAPKAQIGTPYTPEQKNMKRNDAQNMINYGSKNALLQRVT